MEMRPFGKTGLHVSVLGFGGAPVGLLETEQQQIAHILHTLLDAGVNLIDTAASYAGSEEAIGKAVSQRRDEFILVSKCGQAFPEFEGEAWSASLIQQTIDRSLKRLQTDHVDVMLLHSCSLEILQKGEALGALVKARDAGKVRLIGYSGDNEEAVYAAELPDVAVIETSVNIVDQYNLDHVLPIARENQIGVIAKRPIANAAWKELKAQPGFYAEYARTYTERFARMQMTLADLGFEGAPQDVWPEIALRFTLSQPGIHTAIIGTTRVEHLQHNLRAASHGPLPAEAIQCLRKRFAQVSAEEPWRGEI